ncbi:MAG: histidine kinase N-terminal 7TM domain-containing protein [Candidatus Saccharibacteria bacterium]|nr:histidine kinase N-terminal 7TM domain-containing protein [Candidatus Saccharibacteria bacterium]
MQIINILLMIVAVLALISGITTFFGSTKGDKVRSAWFLIATVFAAVWVVSVLLLQVARPGTNVSSVSYPACFAYISVLFIDVALLGYIVWHKKSGKIATLVFVAISVIFSLFVVANPKTFQSDIIISGSVNSVVFNVGLVYFTYIALACALTVAVFSSLTRQIGKSKSLRVRGSNIVLLVGFAISSLVTFVVDLVLTFWDWSFSWLGPLAISATIIAFYYSILRYRALKLNSRWLRFFSYVIVIATIAILYMVVFYLVFLAMFRGAVPSTEVIVLNFVMVCFFLLLMPALNEVLTYTRNLISGNVGNEDDGLSKEEGNKLDGQKDRASDKK